MEKIPLNVWVDQELFEELRASERSPTQVVAEALDRYLRPQSPTMGAARIEPKGPDGPALDVLEKMVERRFADFRSQMKIELMLLRERLEDIEARYRYQQDMNYR